MFCYTFLVKCVFSCHYFGVEAFYSKLISLFTLLQIKFLFLCYVVNISRVRPHTKFHKNRNYRLPEDYYNTSYKYHIQLIVGYQ